MQKDLFGAATVTPLSNPHEQKTDFLHRFRIQLRLDQTIIAVLLLLVVYVLIFSFGVESGKRYAMAEIKSERAMRERMARELGEKIFANSQPQEINPSSAGFEASKPPVMTAVQPAAVKAPTDPAVKPSGKPGKYMIQAVTFTSKSAAEQELKKFLKKGYNGMIIPKGKFQQVCVTGFETRDKATQILGHLKTEGLAPKDAYIRTVS